jgi:hypothetical protein
VFKKKLAMVCLDFHTKVMPCHFIIPLLPLVGELNS